MTADSSIATGGPLSGALHVLIAFDWGDEVRLDEARRLVPAEFHNLARKSRTPSSIAYHAPPLRFRLGSVDLPGISRGLPADATLFDFGAISVAVHAPLEMDAASLAALAGRLAEPKEVLDAVKSAVQPLFEKLHPAIVNPVWSELSEEYFVLQLLPGPALPDPEALLAQHAPWLAGLLRLESLHLSAGEIADALRFHLSYGPRDLFVPDWAAAVVVDDECDEVLDAIAFANMQLLEFRHIDGRLDARLLEAYGLIQELARTWLPFWRSHTRSLRALGEMKVEAMVMLERSGNVLKLVGDPYLARAYHLLSSRFHLDEWDQSVRRALSVLEGTYQSVSDQSSHWRTEVLELIVVLLILFEIVMAFVRH